MTKKDVYSKLPQHLIRLLKENGYDISKENEICISNQDAFHIPDLVSYDVVKKIWNIPTGKKIIFK